MVRRFRIHGDNIVECERTLQIVSDALACSFTATDAPIHKPIFKATLRQSTLYVELLPGHNRWGVNMSEIISTHGGALRENADSYFTEVFGDQEVILFAIEYCSALPAGNNAWQRNGRAISSVMAGVHYFYLAEIGGLEFDDNRIAKAPRFPNPIVPFSYIAASMGHSAFCLPVFNPHPTITDNLYARYESIFGYNDCVNVIKSLIYGENHEIYSNNLINKTLKMVQLLTDGRKGTNPLSGRWGDLLNSSTRINWLENNVPPCWRKKKGTKVLVSNSYNLLLDAVMELGCIPIGSSDMPLCVIPQKSMTQFAQILSKLYPTNNITIDTDRPLAIVWITGFKPRGDDSRPDRGLPPLARMTLGWDAQILAIVSGPANPSTWKLLQSNKAALIEYNGLWQAIFHMCNYVLVDSATCHRPLFLETEATPPAYSTAPSFRHKQTPDGFTFGEHDTDTAIHQILSHCIPLEVRECLCNPPSGDWSGIDFYHSADFILRWTSLPRVSHVGGKRPDHLFQHGLGEKASLWIVESKQNWQDLEQNIGISLKKYITDLFIHAPSCCKHKGASWRYYNGSPVSCPHDMVAIAAFEYNGHTDLPALLSKFNLDCVIAIEFDSTNSILHIVDYTTQKEILTTLQKAKRDLAIPGFEIQIH